MYGIIHCTYNGKFIRHWVKLPSKKPALYDSQSKAEKMAYGMEKAAKENGILSVSYRARKYDKKYCD